MNPNKTIRLKLILIYLIKNCSSLRPWILNHTFLFNTSPYLFKTCGTPLGLESHHLENAST